MDWIMSASLLVRRSAAEQVGGVDESYFMYSDETDLQYRLRQAGWKVYYLPEVVTVHFGGGSSSHWRRRKLIYRGKLLFFRKHYGHFAPRCFGSCSARVRTLQGRRVERRLARAGLALTGGERDSVEPSTYCA